MRLFIGLFNLSSLQAHLLQVSLSVNFGVQCINRKGTQYFVPIPKWFPTRIFAHYLIRRWIPARNWSAFLAATIFWSDVFFKCVFFLCPHHGSDCFWDPLGPPCVAKKSHPTLDIRYCFLYVPDFARFQS